MLLDKNSQKVIDLIQILVYDYCYLLLNNE